MVIHFVCLYLVGCASTELSRMAATSRVRQLTTRKLARTRDMYNLIQTCMLSQSVGLEI
jgi:hypothetical protein